MDRGPRNDRSPEEDEHESDEDEEEPFEFDAYFDDFRREFRDTAPRASTMTRTRRLYDESGLDPSTFRDHLYEARARTKKATNVSRRTTFYTVLEKFVLGG